MKSILVAFVGMLLLIACNNKKGNSPAFNTSRIASQTFTIDITKDTTLLTKKGAVVKIPKGALTNEDNNSVELEIKEAYSIEDMLLAGLTTSSNGQALSSAYQISMEISRAN